MVKNKSVSQRLSWLEIEPGLLKRSRLYLTGHVILGQVDSTNDWALNACQDPDRLPVVCLAEQQLAGRGRNGRRWVSPHAQNIYLSLVSQFRCPVAKLTGLSVAIGVELARILRRYGIDVALKWPNDLLVDGRKLAGVLVETRVKAGNRACVVIGVGFNYNMHDCDASGIDQGWTDICRAMNDRPVPSRNQLAAELINALVNVCILYPGSGLSGWLEAWGEFDACHARLLEVIEGENRYTGIGDGVDEMGALRIIVDGEVKTVHSSEVSIRVVN